MATPPIDFSSIPEECIVSKTETGNTTTLTLNTAETLPAEAEALVSNEHHDIPKKTITPEQFLSMVRGMLASEKITPAQARQLRQQFGIPNNYFTKKKADPAKAKRKKKIAEASRRYNRYNDCMKGHKIAAGK